MKKGIIFLFCILIFISACKQVDISQKFYETIPTKDINLTPTAPIYETQEEMENRILSNPVIKKALDCKIVGACNNIIAVNCKAEVDGPLFYVEKNSGDIVGYCGGYCLSPLESGYCKHCPPENWTCTEKFKF